MNQKYNLMLPILLLSLSWAGVSQNPMASSGTETAAPADSAPAPDTEKAVRPNPEAIGRALQTALDKDRLIRLLAQASRFGGTTVSIPRSLQQVPYNLIPQAEALRQRGVTIRLKSLTFRDLVIEGKDTYTWDQNLPVLPRMMRFSRLAVEAEAEYRNIRVPLGGDFRDGVLPFDYLLNPSGFDITVIPERAKDQFTLRDVKLRLGNGLTSAIANLLVSPKVGELLLRYGVGQTIKLAGDQSAGGSGTDWFSTGKKVFDAFGVGR